MDNFQPASSVFGISTTELVELNEASVSPEAVTHTDGRQELISHETAEQKQKQA